jgi:hypothetical protein
MGIGTWEREFKVIEKMEKMTKVQSQTTGDVQKTESADNWIPLEEIEKNPKQYLNVLKQTALGLEL